MRFSQLPIKRILELVEENWAKASLLIAFACVYSFSFVLQGPNLEDLNHMELSGVTFLILGLWFSMNVHDRMTTAIDQLYRRGAITGIKSAEEFTRQSGRIHCYGLR
jgi:hypothetical protein